MKKQDQALKNTDLINRIIEKQIINKSSITKEDLFQQGFIGLIEAINTYDDNIGIEFNEYASIYIKFYINQLFINKKYKTIKIVDEENRVNDQIRIKNLDKYLKKLDTNKVNILKMYFGLNDISFDINNVAFMNSIPTNEIYNVLHEGMLELKYLIENDNIKRNKKNNFKRDSDKYMYYWNYTKKDVDRASLLLSDEEKRIQKLRFNKEKVTKLIKKQYKRKVHKSMLFYLDRLETFASDKDDYVKMELEERNKNKEKIKTL